MKTSKLFLVLGIVVAVAPIGARAEVDLDDNDSVIKRPRVQESIKISVDAGLALIFNKMISNAQGKDKVALEAAKTELKTANENLAKAAEEAKVGLADAKKVVDQVERAMKAAEKAEQVLPKEFLGREGRVGDDTSRSTKPSRLRGRPVPGGNDYTRFYKDASDPHNASNIAVNEAKAAQLEKAAAQLVKAREKAALVLEDAGEALKLTEEITTKNGTRLRILRVAGNVVIALDVAGHGWALYENTKTPLIGGGIYKLGAEVAGDVFGLLEAKVAPTIPHVRPTTPDGMPVDPRGGGKKPVEPTHGGGDVKPVTPVVPVTPPAEREAPPISKERPKFPAPKPKLP